MAGLVLKLRDGERVLVNGAVIEASGRGCKLRVLTPDTHILRLRDAIDPAEATTPVARLTHLIQMIVAGAVDVGAASREALDGLDGLHAAFVDVADRALVEDVRRHVTEGRAYPALRALGELRQREAEILGAPPVRASTHASAPASAAG